MVIRNEAATRALTVPRLRPWRGEEHDRQLLSVPAFIRRPEGQP
jgi:hypothetical protein